MRRVKVILNPTAGRGYGAKVEPKLRKMLAEEGVEYDLVRTGKRWHASELALEAVAEDYELVVAAGGDGTTHEVVNGLMTAAGDGIAGTLGVLPIGSGSDFAHTIGVPPDLRLACRRLAQGKTRIVDVGRVILDGNHENARFFDNTVGMGFDGVVTAEALKITRLRGVPMYILVVLRTIMGWRGAPQVTIETDDQTFSLAAMMVTIANGSREGGTFFVAPRAEPDDGIFDLCIAGEVSRLGMLGLLPHFMRGTHVDREPITMARSKNVMIHSHQEMVVHADGEMLCMDGHRLQIEILPNRLRVWS